MATHKSAIKEHRKSITRNLRNRMEKNEIKTQLKKIKAALSSELENAPKLESAPDSKNTTGKNTSALKSTSGSKGKAGSKNIAVPSTPVDVKKLANKYYSLLDKAAKNNVIHKSNADRKKSRMMAMINKAQKEA